ncbi:MAG: adenylate cyclase, partial [Acidimicrobiia bacterium]
STAHALGMDPLQAEIRQIVFFDTPDLDLNRAGLVVRARRLPGGRGDTVVKLRPVVPDHISADLRSSGSVGIEVDAMPGGFVCSASMKGKTTASAVLRVVQGLKRPGSIFSKEQKRFFAEYAPEGLKIGQLDVLGPILTLKLRFSPPELGRKMVAELWLYPDGSRILELSTKAVTGEAFDVGAQTRAYLASRGVDLDADQQTKTKGALEFFSAALRRDSARA